MKTPPAPALPCSAATTRRSVASMIASVTSSIACDVAPRLVGRAVGRLDDVEVQAVRPEVGAAEQHEHARRAARARARSAARQPLALRRAHRAVVEVEVQVADAAVGLVADLAPGRRSPARARRCDAVGQAHSTSRGEGERRRQLERVGGVLAAHMADPDRAVDAWRAAPRRRAARSRGPARPARVCGSACASNRRHGTSNSRSRTPGAPSAQRILRSTVRVSSRCPVDAAVGLPHQRPPAPARARAVSSGAVRDPVRARSAAPRASPRAPPPR